MIATTLNLHQIVRKTCLIFHFQAHHTKSMSYFSVQFDLTQHFFFQVRSLLGRLARLNPSLLREICFLRFTWYFYQIN